MFIKWDITGKCNLSCLHCSVGKSYNTGNLAYGDLDTVQVLEICNRLIAGKVTDVQILGGEPFARKDILIILKKLSEAGIRICINTNAQLITEEIISELEKLKIYIINISLDGFDEKTNDFVRGAGSYKKTLEKMQMILKNRKICSNTIIGINFVLMKHMLSYPKELIEFCVNNGIKYLAINDLWLTENAVLNENRIFVNSIIDKVNFLDQLCQSNNFRVNLRMETMPLLAGALNLKYNTHFITCKQCGAGDKIVYIQANGEVYPCIKCREYSQFFRKVDKCKISILDSTLEEIIETPYFKKFYEFKEEMAKLKAECDSCLYHKVCMPCPFEVANGSFDKECNIVNSYFFI